MTMDDIDIGGAFLCDGVEWKCTDKGTRTVIAIKVSEDPSWMNGPPYAVQEIVFDEYDLEGCVAK